MSQTKQQRKYWALRRTKERAIARRELGKTKKPQFRAETVAEWEKLKREYPDIQVNLAPEAIQTRQLFDTEELIDV